MLWVCFFVLYQVWESSLALACWAQMNPAAVKQQRVLELGSGCGFGGIMLAAAGARSVGWEGPCLFVLYTHLHIAIRREATQDRYVVKHHNTEWCLVHKSLLTPLDGPELQYSISVTNYTYIYMYNT